MALLYLTTIKMQGQNTDDGLLDAIDQVQAVVDEAAAQFPPRLYWYPGSHGVYPGSHGVYPGSHGVFRRFTLVTAQYEDDVETGTVSIEVHLNFHDHDQYHAGLIQQHVDRWLHSDMGRNPQPIQANPCRRTILRPKE